MQGHCLYDRPAYPRSGSKTRRRDARRNVRNALGTSNDDAPGLLAALTAVESLRRIIDLASDGRYGLAIVRPSFPGEYVQVRMKEQFRYGDRTEVEYLEPTMETSTLIHEPVTETSRRERQIRREIDASVLEFA